MTTYSLLENLDADAVVARVQQMPNLAARIELAAFTIRELRQQVAADRALIAESVHGAELVNAELKALREDKARLLSWQRSIKEALGNAITTLQNAGDF